MNDKPGAGSGIGQYATKLLQEISRFGKVKQIHALPDIHRYWYNKFLRPKLAGLGIDGIIPFFAHYVDAARPAAGSEPVRILSIGAGNCDTEMNIARELVTKGNGNFVISCMDINREMLNRGETLARKSGLADKFAFIEADINSWEHEEAYHVIMASHALHHFVDLEILFDRIASALHPDGYFITNDVVGRNGHMRWPEAIEHVNMLWALLEDRHRYNNLLKRLEPTYENWDCSTEGFEGIRAQDILPLLVKRFHFDLSLGFNNLIDIFIDRTFGHNFKRGNSWDERFIDYVEGLDNYLIERGAIKPTRIIAAMTTRPTEKVKFHKNLSPEFCIRPTDAVS